VSGDWSAPGTEPGWSIEEAAPTWAPAAGGAWPEPARAEPDGEAVAGSEPATPVPAGTPATRTDTRNAEGAGDPPGSVATLAGDPLARPAGPAHRAARRGAGRVRAEPVRPSALPYRVGPLRRARSLLALLVLTALGGLALAVVMIAVVAGLASAISSASS
jgi:hypothetical protein